MISVSLTAYKEKDTVGKALDALLPQNPGEILVICPDSETAGVAQNYMKKFKTVKLLKDEGRGKPAALNLAFKKAKGDILILTDGDVFVGENSIAKISRHFIDKDVGAVTGRPVSINKRSNMFGYWAHLLTDAGAHEERKIRDKKNEFLDCSGYLYAIRAGIVNHIPENALSDDAVISQLIWKSGRKIKYEEKAVVFVKYPDNFNDWIKQKGRSAGGYHQIKNITGEVTVMRSFFKEAINGWHRAITYAETPKEFFWTLLLFIARVYLWILTYYDLFTKKSFSDIWKRVESTKY